MTVVMKKTPPTPQTQFFGIVSTERPQAGEVTYCAFNDQ